MVWVVGLWEGRHIGACSTTGSRHTSLIVTTTQTGRWTRIHPDRQAMYKELARGCMHVKGACSWVS